jgi:hypothetical protein
MISFLGELLVQVPTSQSFFHAFLKASTSKHQEYRAAEK